MLPHEYRKLMGDDGKKKATQEVPRPLYATSQNRLNEILNAVDAQVSSSNRDESSISLISATNFSNSSRDHDLAQHLLEIGDPKRWRASQPAASTMPIDLNIKSRTMSATQIYSTVHLDASKSEISITKYYEPKFYELYLHYVQSSQVTVDLSSHLMAISLQTLISFSCWARESAARSVWIKQKVEDNVDLRPEVRNGLSMILIYCLSTAKAKHVSSGQDMFSILQEPETGLGIVNKTSLKIYNDPFNYFSFLKSCITGLIDAGKIPENERHNQPKKSRRQVENKDEVVAFSHLQRILVELLNRGEIALAKSKVQQISALWQQRLKNARNNRFSSALLILQTPESLRLLSPVLSMAGLDVSVEWSDEVPGPQHPAEAHRSPAVDDLSSLEHNHTPPASPLTKPITEAESDVEEGEPLALGTKRPVPWTSRTDGEFKLSRTSRFVPALRFERVGAREWEMQETKILDVQAFVLSKECSFFLVEGSQLQHQGRSSSWPDSLPRRFVAQQSGFISLSLELQQRQAMMTSWAAVEHQQLILFLQVWQQQEDDMDLLDFWSGRLRKQQLQRADEGARGLLAFEVTTQIGIVVRSNEHLALGEDCWRLIFPCELIDRSKAALTFEQLLCDFFPQLRGKLGRQGRIVVKYWAHGLRLPVVQPPDRLPSLSRYQTLGTLDEPASDLLSRFDNRLSFHDFVLQAA